MKTYHYENVRVSVLEKELDTDLTYEIMIKSGNRYQTIGYVESKFKNTNFDLFNISLYQRPVYSIGEPEKIN